MTTPAPIAVRGPAPLPAHHAEGILRALPQWFGIEDALLRYAGEAEQHPTFTAWAPQEPAPAGFVTVTLPEAGVGEMTCLAVLPQHHRRGVGRALVAAAEAWMAQQGARESRVKTLGPSHPDPHYALTRGFYAALGYAPVEERLDLWGPQTPCLVLCKTLGQPERTSLPGEG